VPLIHIPTTVGNARFSSLPLLLLLYFRLNVRVELEAMTDAEGATLQVRYVCTQVYMTRGLTPSKKRSEKSSPFWNSPEQHGLRVVTTQSCGPLPI
jgi:hypothetical protein